MDSALNDKHQQVNLKRLKAARAARVNVFGNERVSKLACSLTRYWYMGLLKGSCAEARTDCELCLRNLRGQLRSILQLLPSVGQSFHFSVSLLEYNRCSKRVSDCFMKDGKSRVWEWSSWTCPCGPRWRGPGCFLPRPRMSCDLSVQPCREWFWSPISHPFPAEVRCGLLLPCPLKMGPPDAYMKVTGIDPETKGLQFLLGLKTVTLSTLLFQAVLMIRWWYRSDLRNHQAHSRVVTHNLCFTTASVIFFLTWEDSTDINEAFLFSLCLLAFFMFASLYGGPALEERLKSLFNHTSCHLLMHLLLTAVGVPLLSSWCGKG